jgi:hypothetical protein
MSHTADPGPRSSASKTRKEPVGAGGRRERMPTLTATAFFETRRTGSPNSCRRRPPASAASSRWSRDSPSRTGPTTSKASRSSSTSAGSSRAASWRQRRSPTSPSWRSPLPASGASETYPPRANDCSGSPSPLARNALSRKRQHPSAHRNKKKSRGTDGPSRHRSKLDAGRPARLRLTARAAPRPASCRAWPEMATRECRRPPSP